MTAAKDAKAISSLKAGADAALKAWRGRADRKFSETISQFVAADRTGKSGQTAKRVIVDMTDVIAQVSQGHALTGIPRVVLRFAEAASHMRFDRDRAVIFVYFNQSAGHFFELEPSAAKESAEPSARPFDWVFDKHSGSLNGARSINLPKIRAKYEDKPNKRRLQIAKGKARLLQRQINHRIVTMLRRRADGKRFEFQRNDIFLMLGSGWHALPVMERLDTKIQRGDVTPVILVHDIIPLLNIGEANTVTKSVFRYWLDRAVKATPHLIANSRTTRDDLLNYFASVNKPLPNVTVIPLVHEFVTPKPSPLSGSVEILLSSKFALFVGPSTGRKNALRLFEAWKLLLSRLGPDRTPLLAVTDAKAPDEIYASHIKPIASHIRFVGQPSDFELRDLYRGALFSVFPSLYEGWGLPVGESLWHGTPCITSATSSLPEVGGHLCDYIDPLDPGSIAIAAEKLALNDDYRRARAAAIRTETLRSWADFSQDVLEFSESCLPLGGAEAVADRILPS